MDEQPKPPQREALITKELVSGNRHEEVQFYASTVTNRKINTLREKLTPEKDTAKRREMVKSSPQDQVLREVDKITTGEDLKIKFDSDFPVVWRDGHKYLVIEVRSSNENSLVCVLQKGPNGTVLEEPVSLDRQDVASGIIVAQRDGFLANFTDPDELKVMQAFLKTLEQAASGQPPETGLPGSSDVAFTQSLIKAAGKAGLPTRETIVGLIDTTNKDKPVPDTATDEEKLKLADENKELGKRRKDLKDSIVGDIIDLDQVLRFLKAAGGEKQIPLIIKDIETEQKVLIKNLKLKLGMEHPDHKGFPVMQDHLDEWQEQLNMADAQATMYKTITEDGGGSITTEFFKKLYSGKIPTTQAVQVNEFISTGNIDSIGKILDESYEDDIKNELNSIGNKRTEEEIRNKKNAQKKQQLAYLKSALEKGGMGIGILMVFALMSGLKGQ